MSQLSNVSICLKNAVEFVQGFEYQQTLIYALTLG
jgi:hypothetical protein